MLRKFLLISTIFGLLIAAFFALLLFSTSALRLLGLGVESVSSGSIILSGINGTLYNGFSIKDLKISQTDTLIKAKDLRCHILLGKILRAQVVFETLGAARLEIISKKGQQEEGSNSQVEVPKVPIGLKFKDVFINTLLVKDNTGKKTYLLKNLHLSGGFGRGKIKIKKLTGMIPEYGGDFHIWGEAWQKGNLPAIKLSLVSKARFPDVGKWDLRGDVHGRLDRLLIKASAKGNGSIDLKGVVSGLVTSKQIDWKGKIRIKGFKTGRYFPSAPDGLLDMESEVSGVDARMKAIIKGSFKSAALKIKSFFFDIDTDSAGLRITKGQLNVFDGLIAGSGQLFWGKALRLKVQLYDIWPTYFPEEISGKISGELDIDGDFKNKGPDFYSIKFQKVYGTVNGKNAKLGGLMTIRGDHLVFRDVALTVGTTALNVAGWMDEKAQSLTFSLKSPNIAHLYPEAHGRLFVDGQIKGARATPKVHLKLEGNNLEFEESKTAYLKGRLDISGIQDSIIKSNFETKGLWIKDVFLNRMGLSVNGKRSNHKIIASIKGGDVTSYLYLQGKLDSNFKYSGLIKRFNVKPLNLPKWTLSKEAYLTVTKKTFILTPLCLRDEKDKGRFCLYVKDEKDSLTIHLSGKKIPLKPFSEYLSKSFLLYGYADVNLDLSRRQERVKGAIFFKTDTASLRMLSGKKEYPLDLVLGGSISEKGLKANIDGQLLDNFEVTGILTIPDFRLGKPVSDAIPIQLALDIQGESLAIIQDLVPGLFIYDGSLAAKIRVSGPLKSPDIEARARMENLKAEYPAYGMKIASKHTRVAIKNGLLDLIAQLESVDGSLVVTGKGSVMPSSQSVVLTIKGKDYRLITTPYLKVDISPDLELSIKEKRLDIRGNVLVPWAEIKQVKVAESAILPSPDIEIEGKKERTKKVPIGIYAKVDLKAGEKVTVDAYGLKGRVVGDLQINISPNSPLLLTGILSIKDGTYIAFGTELNIDKGRVIYFSSPPDDPRVEVEAVRTVGDTVVGVRINGSLKSPKVKLFSDPSMPESEIARYLLGGSKGEGFSKAGVITSGANLLISKIRQKLGMLDVLKLQTEENPDDIALIVGTYLRPDLYLKFINDFGDKMTRIILRYEYSKHIEFETETGDSPSAEVFFKLER